MLKYLGVSWCLQLNFQMLQQKLRVRRKKQVWQNFESRWKFMDVKNRSHKTWQSWRMTVHPFFMLMFSHEERPPQRCLKYYLALLLLVSYTRISHKILFVKRISLQKGEIISLAKVWQHRASLQGPQQTLLVKRIVCSIWAWHLTTVCQSATIRWYLEWNLFAISEPDHQRAAYLNHAVLVPDRMVLLNN